MCNFFSFLTFITDSPSILNYLLQFTIYNSLICNADHFPLTENVNFLLQKYKNKKKTIDKLDGKLYKMNKNGINVWREKKIRNKIAAVITYIPTKYNIIVYNIILTCNHKLRISSLVSRLSREIINVFAQQFIYIVCWKHFYKDFFHCTMEVNE